jgi:hypothetical protein
LSLQDHKEEFKKFIYDKYERKRWFDAAAVAHPSQVLELLVVIMSRLIDQQHHAPAAVQPVQSLLGANPPKITVNPHVCVYLSALASVFHAFDSNKLLRQTLPILARFPAHQHQPRPHPLLTSVPSRPLRLWLRQRPNSPMFSIINRIRRITKCPSSSTLPRSKARRTCRPQSRRSLPQRRPILRILATSSRHRPPFSRHHLQ